jgi:phage gp46-like protein
MSDIRTLFISYESGADWLLQQPSLSGDDGLDTAVILSLFTDARAKEGDDVPDPTDLRGWWGDAFAAKTGDRFGSRLWLLGRRKQLPATLSEARGYAEEALAWMVKDGIASRVEVDAFIPRDEMLGLAIAIYKPNGDPVRFRFETLWSNI